MSQSNPQNTDGNDPSDPVPNSDKTLPQNSDEERKWLLFELTCMEERIAARIQDILFAPQFQNRPRSEVLLTGIEAAKRMDCSWSTFKRKYLRHKKIKWAKGRRKFTSSAVEKLFREVFGE